MATKIDSVSARDRLKPRRAPYWHKISTGCYVGFRKMTADSVGTWLARYRDGDKQPSQSLGALDEYPAFERFDRATEQARAWFAHLDKGGTTGRDTVKEVCADYVTHVRREKGDKPADDIAGRFKRWVDATPLADVELAKLTRDHVKAYRTRLMAAPVVVKGNERKRAPDTVNRDLTALRAALNLAFAEGKVTTDFAWREALKPIKGATRRRELYLDRDQRRAFIEHAAPDVGELLRGLSMLPLRPGALASLNAGDYDDRLKSLRIGQDKAGKDRRLRVMGATADYLAKHAHGKVPGAPLLTRVDGVRWNKDAWKHPIKDAVAAAGLPPETTAYSLRHSVITDLVVGGLDLLTVAQVSGTSVAMIEKHYGQLRQTIAATALEQLAL
ncbi:tyrosine-type recombinase/integrase [Achromobacter animicus]|uniref:tyrosine-type recombinase/integrase n=1 Tax=Achromobacter animicus TaxID=1389935 RepID=UPI001466CBF2|nr:tyrosine-type recombinase/integrase [Achromobacter animicus]CAB3900996.1 Tyrosine recombinase XerC [Achromobacter animicus]